MKRLIKIYEKKIDNSFIIFIHFENFYLNFFFSKISNDIFFLCVFAFFLLRFNMIFII